MGMQCPPTTIPRLVDVAEWLAVAASMTWAMSMSCWSEHQRQIQLAKPMLSSTIRRLSQLGEFCFAGAEIPHTVAPHQVVQRWSNCSTPLVKLIASLVLASSMPPTSFGWRVGEYSTNDRAGAESDEHVPECQHSQRRSETVASDAHRQRQSGRPPSTPAGRMAAIAAWPDQPSEVGCSGRRSTARRRPRPGNPAPRSCRSSSPRRSAAPTTSAR